MYYSSMNISVKDIISSNFAVSTDDGDKIYALLNSYFSKDEKVVLNFEGITLMTTAFLNAAIGQLYSNNKYSSEFLNNYISLINVDDQDKHLFGIVVKRAKEYFADKDKFDQNSSDSIYGNN